MNKQLVRTKKRSDDTIVQVVESDDDNNVYVNVDAGTIDEVTKTFIWGNSDDYGPHPVFVNDQGALYVIDAQEGFLGGEGVKTWSANAAANTVKYIDIPEHEDDNHRTWLGYILNPNPTAFTIRVQNKWTTIAGNVSYSQVDEHTIPAATFTTPSATAWSSCFTSIGGVLSDESGDFNDNIPGGTADVPFTFGAINDAIYFGHSAQFRGLSVIVGTAGVYDASGTWEYWNGSAWSTLTIQTVYPPGTDDTPFTSTGVFNIIFEMEDDWALYDIAGDPTSQYWIRFRVTSFTSMTTGPSLVYGNYLLYADTFGSVYPFEYAMNSGDIRLVVFNDTQIGPNGGLIYWQMRSV